MQRTVAAVVVLLLALGQAAAPGAAGVADASTATARLLYAAQVPGGASVATMAADGSDARLLTTPVVGAPPQPHASPDGRWIAYDRLGADPQSAEVVIISADDGREAAVVPDGIRPAWSPTGQRLAYFTATGSERDLVFVEIAEFDGTIVIGSPRVVPLPGIASHAVWSPDGAQVAFTLAQDGAWDDRDLWVGSPDGARQVSRDVSLRDSGQATYAWSPDGQQIAFVAGLDPQSPETRAHLVRSDGNEQRLLSPHPCYWEEAVAWEPYGRYLAVVSPCRGGDIDLVTPEGTWLRSITEGPDFDLAPRDFLFAADGRSLYGSGYVRAPDGGQPPRRLQQVAIDGSWHREITPLYEPSGGWLQVLGSPVPTDPGTMPPMPADPDAEPDDPDPNPDDPPTMPTRSELALACPRDRVPPTQYRDVDPDSPERLHVDCAAWWRFMGGVSRYRFAPAGAITRGQLASALARVLQYSGWRAETTTDYFDDDNGSVHETNINGLREAGVLQGVGRRFDPERPVRRDQMASFAVAAYELHMRRELPEATRDHFPDDAGNVHERNINRSAEADLVDGVSTNSYEPSQGQRRDDVADIGARILDARVAEGGEPPGYGEAFIKRVVDGDTFIADMYRNNGTLVRDVRVRMAGINAPERSACGGPQAKDVLLRGIQRRRVRLSARHEDSVGRDDRPIRFVHVYIGYWLDISQEMLRLGHALWMPHRAEPERQSVFNRTAQRAAARRVGLWDPARCAYGPQQRAALRVNVRWDAPGRDGANLNGEVVRIRNAGSTAVDLSGWRVRESSQHPAYRFAAGTTVPAGSTLKLHVGTGSDRRLRKFWGARRPLFENATADNSMGDGAYLLDPDGDLRAHHMYPCQVGCD